MKQYVQKIQKLENQMKTKEVCYTGLHDTILWDKITSYQAAQEAIALSQTLITSPPFIIPVYLD